MESSCGKRTGEAYLTPLQQKEVAIRHLRSKLKETQCLLLNRESEVEELKERVNRIQEDRAVEECQRAEAQLSVKHSKREIKRLRSVINTMKSILLDKDKGVPHYFIDINVQNKRLEALLETVDKMQESHKSEEQSIISRRDGHSESESKTSETSGAETDTGEEDDEEEEDLQEKDEVETEIKGYLEKGDTAELEAEAAIVWDGSYGGDGSMMHERWATKEQVELRLCDSSARAVSIHVQAGQGVPKTLSQQSLLKLVITSPTGGEDLTVPTESYRDNKDEGVQTDTTGSPCQRPTLRSSTCSPLQSRRETVTTAEEVTKHKEHFSSSKRNVSQVPSSTSNVITNEPKRGICSADGGLSGVCSKPSQTENRLSMSFSECSCLARGTHSSSCSSSLGDSDQEKDGPAYLSPPASIDEAVESTCAGGVDLVTAFYGCLYAGCVPVTVRPPHSQNLTSTLPTVKMIVEVSKSVCVLTTLNVMKLLKSKESLSGDMVKPWPQILDTDDLPRKRPSQLYRAPTAEMLAYLDFSVSTTGILAGVKMSHAAVGMLCQAVKLQGELYPSRLVALCLDPYCGLGFVLWCLAGVYAGHQSLLIPPMELEGNPGLWLSTVSQYRVRDTFCSYNVMDVCTRGLGSQTEALKARGVNLSCVRSCVVVAEERPRIALTQSFSKLFKDLGLSPRAVSTTFGCRVNVSICLQGSAGPDPTTVYVDVRALRHDRVRLVEKGSPHSLPLMASGKVMPGVKIIIANSETRGPLGDSHLGEIWVASLHCASGYYTIYGEQSPHTDHFSSQLSVGDTSTVWAKTGYLGFVRRTDLTDASGEPHDALDIVGSLDETLELRGLRDHPIDIETSVQRSHKSIAECAVFTWTNLLVVVVELGGPEQEALDLVPVVTNAVLEEHYLVVGVVVVADPGTVPINSRGEKQRMHLRDGFLADQLDPIYVAYNM